MKLLIIAFFLVAKTSWSQNEGQFQKPSATPAINTTQTETSSMADYFPTFDKAHPIAKHLLNEEFYWSPIEETAPFGNDDGADAYAGFSEWRQVNKTEKPMVFLMVQIDYWGYPIFDFNETNIEELKKYLKQSDLNSRFMSGIDAAIVSIAFGQLYLDGTIDEEFKELTKTSIKRQLIPDLLNLWDSEYKGVREIQLTKMLNILNQVN